MLPAADLHCDEDLPGSRLRAAAVYLLQDLLRAGLRAEDDQLREVRPGDVLSRSAVHGLQAVWETRVRTCNYTTCNPVWETCTKNYCYTVCKPVYET